MPGDASRVKVRFAPTANSDWFSKVYEAQLSEFTSGVAIHVTRSKIGIDARLQRETAGMPNSATSHVGSLTHSPCAQGPASHKHFEATRMPCTSVRAAKDAPSCQIAYRCLALQPTNSLGALAEDSLHSEAKSFASETVSLRECLHENGQSQLSTN